MKGGRVKKMNGGSANGKPVSKSKNPGLAKMAKSLQKEKQLLKKWVLIQIEWLLKKVEEHNDKTLS